MLNVTETLDKIKALDTSQDIISGACRRFVSEFLRTQGMPNANVIALKISADNENTDVLELLEGLAMVTVSIAISEAKKGEEQTVLNIAIAMIMKQFKYLIENKMQEIEQFRS